MDDPSVLSSFCLFEILYCRNHHGESFHRWGNCPCELDYLPYGCIEEGVMACGCHDILDTDREILLNRMFSHPDKNGKICWSNIHDERSAVLPGTAVHGDAPQYLRQFTPVADIPSRQRLRSSTSDDLCVPAVRLPTVERRAFSVAGARVWNALPADVTSAPSLFTFRKRLKLHLFPLSYPGLFL